MEYESVEEATQDFIVQWAKALSSKFHRTVEPTPHHVAEVLVNDPAFRNYMTACCLIFGLSYPAHSEYINAACAKLKEDHEAQGCPDITAEWLGEWVTYYCAEISAYPG